MSDQIVSAIKKGETPQIWRFSPAFSQTSRAWDDPAALPQPLQPVCPAPLKKINGVFYLKHLKHSAAHTQSVFTPGHKWLRPRFVIHEEQGGVSSTTAQSEEKEFGFSGIL